MTDSFNRALRRNEFLGLDAYSRHKKYINDYVRFYGKKPSSSSLSQREVKTDVDIVRENYRFIQEGDEEEEDTMNWEKRVAKKYYDKLFKEYALVELKYYKEGRIALRWRTEREVIDGKGQFVCGSLKCDDSGPDLKSWEVNFAYKEDGERKNALVKVRLCSACTDKLHYRKRKEAEREERRKRKRESSRRKALSRSSSSDSDGDRRSLKRITRKQDEQEEEERKARVVETEEEQQKRKEEASKIWSQPVTVQQEQKKREDEFDAFFAGLFE